MEKVIFTDEQRIVHTLIMRALNSQSIGLFYGKMGVAIAFFHYYRHTGTQVYERYAYALLDSVLNNVARNMDISFATGLCGIGWGIEYILQNGFAEGNSAEICEQIDEQIMCFDPRRMSAKTIDDLLQYTLIHCKNGVKFDTQYIIDIEHVISKQNLEQFSIREQSVLYKSNILKFVSSADASEGLFYNKPIGIHKGLAGVLMQKYVVL